jgi:hypothetical protein
VPQYAPLRFLLSLYPLAMLFLLLILQSYLGQIRDAVALSEDDLRAARRSLVDYWIPDALSVRDGNAIGIEVRTHKWRTRGCN